MENEKKIHCIGHKKDFWTITQKCFLKLDNMFFIFMVVDYDVHNLVVPLMFWLDGMHNIPPQRIRVFGHGSFNYVNFYERIYGTSWPFFQARYFDEIPISIENIGNSVILCVIIHVCFRSLSKKSFIRW